MTDQLNSVVGPIFSDLLSVVVDCMYRVARKIDHFVFLTTLKRLDRFV